MSVLMSALIGGLEGVERTRDKRRGEKMDDRKMAMDEGAFAMQQREFELRMKKLGLDLETAEYDRDFRIANGTPRELAQREHEDRLRDIARQSEGLNLLRAQVEQTKSSTAENEAQAEYYRSGGSRRSAAADDPNKLWSNAGGILDDMIKLKADELQEATDAGDAKAVERIGAELDELRVQRETIGNSALAQLGLPMDQFGMDRGAQAAPQSAAPSPVAQQVTPQTANTAIGATAAQLFGPILETMRTGRDVIGSANTNLMNPNVTPQQRMAADVSRNLLMRTLMGPHAWGGGQQQFVPQVAPATPPQQNNTPSFLQMLFGGR